MCTHPMLINLTEGFHLALKCKAIPLLRMLQWIPIR